MISNTDSTLLIYSTEHMRVKVYNGPGAQATVSVGVPGCTVRCVFGGCDSEVAAAGGGENTQTLPPFCQQADADTLLARMSEPEEKRDAGAASRWRGPPPAP